MGKKLFEYSDVSQADLEFIKSVDPETLKSAGVDIEEYKNDIIKALQKQGLVQKEVTVQGKQGTFTRKQWVRASDAKEGGDSGSDNKPSPELIDKVAKEIEDDYDVKVDRKKLSSDINQLNATGTTTENEDLVEALNIMGVGFKSEGGKIHVDGSQKIGVNYKNKEKRQEHTPEPKVDEKALRNKINNQFGSKVTVDNIGKRLDRAEQLKNNLIKRSEALTKKKKNGPQTDAAYEKAIAKHDAKVANDKRELEMHFKDMRGAVADIGDKDIMARFDKIYK